MAAAKPPRSSHRLVCFFYSRKQTCLRLFSQDHVRVSEDLRAALSRPCLYPSEALFWCYFRYATCPGWQVLLSLSGKTRREELPQYLCWHGSILSWNHAAQLCTWYIRKQCAHYSSPALREPQSNHSFSRPQAQLSVLLTPHDPPFSPVHPLLSPSSDFDPAFGILWDYHGDQWNLETDNGRISRADSW